MIKKPYKFRSEDYDQILFTSDQHYNHNPKWVDTPAPWKVRGFSSIEEHDGWLREQYAKVSPDSIIFSLGDPALNSTPDAMMGMFNSTNAHIYHVWGNHFSCDYAVYRNAMNRYLWDDVSTLIADRPLNYEIYPFTIDRCVTTLPEYDNTPMVVRGTPGLYETPFGMTFLGLQCDIKVDHQIIHLSHMAPLIYTRRSVCLFGHSHGELAGSQPDDKDEGQRLDCGIENSIKYNGTAFFTFDDIKTIMASKPVKTLDKHG